MLDTPLVFRLLFRASSYVKAINHVQLNYSQVVQELGVTG
jgi:hypothetical protein